MQISLMAYPTMISRLKAKDSMCTNSALSIVRPLYFSQQHQLPALNRAALKRYIRFSLAHCLYYSFAILQISLVCKIVQFLLKMFEVHKICYLVQFQFKYFVNYTVQVHACMLTSTSHYLQTESVEVDTDIDAAMLYAQYCLNLLSLSNNVFCGCTCGSDRSSVLKPGCTNETTSKST